MENVTTDVPVLDSGDSDGGGFIEERIADDIWRYCSPVLLIVGTVGNLLAMCVLLRRRMRSTTTMFYLAILTFADFFALYTGLLRYWLKVIFDKDFRLRSMFSCRFHTFLVYFSLDMAVWILVAVTVDRAIIVCFPFRAKRLCTIRNARVVLLVIFIAMALLNIHFLWMMGVYKDGEAILCDILPDISPEQYYFAKIIHPWIDFCFYSVIPFSVMIVCNIVIIRQMALSRRRLAAHINGDSQRSAASHANRTKPVSRKATQIRRRERCSNITLTLLTVNIIFLCTTSPIAVYLLGHDDWSEKGTAHDIAVLNLVWSVVNMLQYSNNAIHFFLYCLTGPRFRRELMFLLRRRNRVSHGVDQDTTLDVHPTHTAHI